MTLYSSEGKINPQNGSTSDNNPQSQQYQIPKSGDRALIEAFVLALFRLKLPEHFILVWEKKGVLSSWFTEPEDAIDYIASRCAEVDIYVGLGLSGKNYGPKNRCEADKIVAISSFWIDIDIKHPCHKKANLPETIDEALSLLGPPQDTFYPSLIIHSGHGLQAYWLLDKIWNFASEEERNRAALYSRAIQRKIINEADKRGWSVDNTSDLSRIYRVAGTFNHKGEILPVTVYYQREKRYKKWEVFDAIREEVEQIEKENSHSSSAKKKSESITGGEIKESSFYLSSDAEPPQDKFDALLENNELFKLTWNRQRDNLKDSSFSGYDMSLANFAAAAGWEDQEIVNLIIAFRRKHNTDFRSRYDYYQRTIKKAREGLKSRPGNHLDELNKADEHNQDDQREAGATGREEENDSPNNSSSSTIQERQPFTQIAKRPDPLGKAAFYGLPGELVRLIEPHSEADNAAILVQFLTFFGNIIGRSAHFRAEADKHFTNLFVLIIGLTSKGRKGSSLGQVKMLFESIDPYYVERRARGGLSSGEGLIYAVRDPIEKQEPIKENGKVTAYQKVITDEGVDDKRLLVVQGEFAQVLKVAVREGNILSTVIREAWDGISLSTLTRNNPLTATDPHISIIGHITKDEIRRNLDSTECANGFANRFLPIFSQRSKLLPEGGQFHKVDKEPIILAIKEAVKFASNVQEVRRDEEAKSYWCELYPFLSEGKPGLLGAITSRSEAQVMRLALIYALLDRSPVIKKVHLEAALEIWRYCEDSARFIFGDVLGDPIADEILRELRNAGTNGLTRTEISNSLGRNVNATKIATALKNLAEAGQASCEMETVEGAKRPTERWKATQHTIIKASGEK